MRLGDKGYQWVEDINKCYTDGASLCNTWQQEFFENFWKKAHDFENEAYITEKQLMQLNKIADIFGVPNARVGDFDEA